MRLRTVQLALALCVLLLAGCPGSGGGDLPGDQRTLPGREDPLPGHELTTFPPGRSPTLVGLSPDRLVWHAAPNDSFTEFGIAPLQSGGSQPSWERIERGFRVAGGTTVDPYRLTGYSDNPIVLTQRGSDNSSPVLFYPGREGESRFQPAAELELPRERMTSAYLYSSDGARLFAVGVRAGSAAGRGREATPTSVLIRAFRVRSESGGTSLEQIWELDRELSDFGPMAMAAVSSDRNSVLLALSRVTPEEMESHLVRVTPERTVERLAGPVEGNISKLVAAPDGTSAVFSTSNRSVRQSETQQLYSVHRWTGAQETDNPVTTVLELDYNPSGELTVSRDLSRIYQATVGAGLYELRRSEGEYRRQHYPQIVTNRNLVWLPRYRALVLQLGYSPTLFGGGSLKQYNDYLKQRAETRLEQLRSSLEDTGYTVPELKYSRVIDARNPQGRDFEQLYLDREAQASSPEYYFRFPTGGQYWNLHTKRRAAAPPIIDVTAVADDAEATEERAREAANKLRSAAGIGAEEDLRPMLRRHLGETGEQQQISLCTTYRVKNYPVCRREVQFYFITPEMGLKTIYLHRHPKPENPRLFVSEEQARQKMIEFARELTPIATQIDITSQYLVGHYPSYNRELQLPTHPLMESPNVSWKFRIAQESGEYYINAYTGQVN